MVELFANSGDPDQTPHSVASDLGLHCLPITLLRVSDYIGLMRIYAVNKPHLNMQNIMIAGLYNILTPLNPTCM